MILKSFVNKLKNIYLHDNFENWLEKILLSYWIKIFLNIHNSCDFDLVTTYSKKWCKWGVLSEISLLSHAMQWINMLSIFVIVECT